MVSHPIRLLDREDQTLNIHGICPPVVTPFSGTGDVEYELLREELRYLVREAGVHGVVLGGSTGEGHTLTTDEAERMVGIAADEVGAEVQVIAGLIVNSTKAAAERGRAVATAGAVALQVTPVHYLFRPDDDAMQAYFAEVVDTTGLPVIIYNVVPWSYLSPELLTKIVAEVDGVIGVKQSAGDLKLVAELLRIMGDRGLVMSATDALLYPSFVLGAHGAIAGINSAAPSLSVELWDAVQRGDHTEARRIHNLLLPIWNALEGDNMPACVKYALSVQGREGGHARAPMPSASEARKSAIRASLAAAGLVKVAVPG